MIDAIVEEIEDIDLRKANILLERYENQLEYWENEKEISFNQTQPGATDYSKEPTSDGSVSNKNEVYVISLEKIEKKISVLKKKIANIMSYIDKEMKILGQEDETTKRIIELRDDEEYMKSNKGHKRAWWQIAQSKGVWLSERQCQRRYDRYKSRCRTSV